MCINFDLFMVFILPLLSSWWSVPTLLPAFLERGGSCTLLLVLAHGGALRLRVTQLINRVIHIEVITKGSCLGV